MWGRRQVIVTVSVAEAEPVASWWPAAAAARGSRLHPSLAGGRRLPRRWPDLVVAVADPRRRHLSPFSHSLVAMPPVRAKRGNTGGGDRGRGTGSLQCVVSRECLRKKGS
ncbi:hypothetical protein EE612_010085 [Oryza sativa]|nr:hypothetical protein EE612_010085 [Oryza sativa]